VRNNDVPRLIVDWLHSQLTGNKQLYAEFESTNRRPVRDLFNDCPPDMAVCHRDNVITPELTVYHETNLNSSKLYKQCRYQNIQNNLSTLVSPKHVSNYTIEVSTLGFISEMNTFFDAIKIPVMPISLKQDIIRSAIKNSFLIYCNRNNTAN